MRCQACDAANPDDARFCSRCGTAQPRACHACGHTGEAGAKFCSECGASLAADRAPPPQRDLERYVPETLLRKIRAARVGGAMRGERRTVTMLFADIEGSTAAAERLDPEEWAEVVNGTFERLIAPVYRYEGTLARLQGDAILAFFGAPVAHEDDAVRAVRSGLEMVEAIRRQAADVRRTAGVPIAVRVGINTGLVVVGEVGSDLRVEYTALGDAINVAARMEQLAEPGSVLITEHTAGLLGDGFRLTEIGPVEVRGRTGAVTALRVDGTTAVAAPATSHADLVGREDEQAALSACLRRLLDGLGGVVTVVGEAGIGKSHLLTSVRREADAAFVVASTSEDEGELAWLEARCRSFDTGVPYAPFLELAARWLDLDDLADEATFGRIADVVARSRGAPDVDMTTFLAQVVRAHLPPEPAALVAALQTPVLHAKTTDAIVAYLESEAQQRPIVIVLDDLHWADALSLGLTERLIASAERVPLMLLLSLRPVRDEPSWRLVELASREAAHRHTMLELDALGPDAAGELLERLLGDHPVPPSAREHILERADGNPLFVEELVGTVRDAGTPRVPTSLAGLLSARLDRLDEDGRLVAEVAAVVGREFTAEAVATLAEGVDVEATLRELVRQGVLSERRRRPQPLYAFRHALIQEAAYDTVLLRDRRELHGRLAAHLQEVEPDLPHEIARHHLASARPSAAFPWLIEAGARANRAMALAEAIRLLTTAMEVAPADADPEQVARAHLALGEAYSLVPDLDQASAAYQDLVDLGRATDQPSLQVSALNRLGFNAAVIAADFRAADDYLRRARQVAEEAGDELGLAEYHMNACFIAAARGELAQAIGHDEETVRLGAANDAAEIRLVGLVRRAMNLVSSTDFVRVGAARDEAWRLATEVGSEVSLALLAAHVDAVLLQHRGDLAGSLETMTTASRTLDRFGSFSSAVIQSQAGRLALRLGEVETAVEFLGAALRTAERNGQPFATAAASATLARCYALCGDVERSATNRARALEALALPLGDFLASSVWADLGGASVEAGAWRDAEADLALGLEASSGTRFLERPELLAGAARVALARGDATRARQLVADARAYSAEHGLGMFDPPLAALAGSVSRLEGDLDGADQQLARAEGDAARTGMRLLVCDVATARSELAVARDRAEEAAEHRERRDGVIDTVTRSVLDPRLRAGLDRRLRAGLVGHAHGHPTPSP